MGGRRRGDDEAFEAGRPVEPGEARAHGEDPDAVTIHRRGDTGGDQDVGERAAMSRRDDAGREEAGERGESEQRRSDGEGTGQSMEKSDKVLISALAVLGVVALAVILVLSFLKTPEWIQFVLALILFAAVGLGAYRYVITPSGRRQESGTE